MIVQSGKYNDLLDSGLDFKALVTAHETSMELVDVENATENSSPTISTQKSFKLREENGESKSEDQSDPNQGSSKLIKEEERETGRVSLSVYKLYCTESFGWLGVVAVLFFSLAWQGTLMASDYWLAYETSSKRAASFNPSFFIEIYAIIAAVSCVLILLRIILATVMGLKTSQIFFGQMLHSILHAPMSFFDTTPSGRILSRVKFSYKDLEITQLFVNLINRIFFLVIFILLVQASTDQTNVDIFIPFFMSVTIAMYVTLISIIIITCQYTWPTVIFLIPLGWLNIWCRVWVFSCTEICLLKAYLTECMSVFIKTETTAVLTNTFLFLWFAGILSFHISRIDTAGFYHKSTRDSPFL